MSFELVNAVTSTAP